MSSPPRLHTLYLVVVGLLLVLFLLLGRQSPAQSFPHKEATLHWPAEHGRPSTSLPAGTSFATTYLVSPSGRYRFALQPTGRLVLEEPAQKRVLFVLGAHGNDANKPVTWQAELTTAGELRLEWRYPSRAGGKVLGGQIASSTKLPGCGKAASSLSKQADSVPVLELEDSGRLRIRSGSQDVCVLYAGITESDA